MTAPDPGKLALALDHLLCHPDAAAMIDSLRARLSVSARDQLDAAARDVLDRVERVAAAHDMTVGSAPAVEHPGWVRLGALSAFATWASGRADTCLHDPRPDRAGYVAAAAWRPGLVVCPACTHLLVLRHGLDGDRRCDGCGRVTTGVEHDDGIVPAVLIVGPVLYSFGMCGECTYEAST